MHRYALKISYSLNFLLIPSTTFKKILRRKCFIWNYKKVMFLIFLSYILYIIYLKCIISLYRTSKCSHVLELLILYFLDFIELIRLQASTVEAMSADIGVVDV